VTVQVLGRVVICVMLTLAVLPSTALAGAPNYDCVVDHGRGHLAIDQITPLVVATGVGASGPIQADATEIVQNGPSLDFTTAFGGSLWTVSIRRLGGSVTIARPGTSLRGRCVVIPGNFVLRAADAGGHVVRRDPSSSAPPRASIPLGGPVWQPPASVPKGHWLPVVVVRPGAGTPSRLSGWLRQRGPYESRP
jgi:hypothetical protein